jgi:glycosyltransferase involved in cell wall biosynthesis
MSATTGIPAGLVSVIIPCFNPLEFLRPCLAALMRHTRSPWELIAVDDGSTDGTATYLAGVQDASPVPITVVTNPTHRGFPAAVNQGLSVALGDYLVILDHDVVVTDGWLDQLIALTAVDPAIGLAGPMSNCASAAQLVEDAPYTDLDRMHDFARRWREEHRGRWLIVPGLSGFCVLMRRAVFEAIGGLDERPGSDPFDDGEFAERARRAGFALAVAQDLFVHHFGGSPVAPAGPRTDGFASRRARVSLTLIVRDEQENLPHCLGSVRGLFDEIVVVDTGSTDGTRGVAEAFGARVFEFPWIDDFAAARNAALAHATGDYAFWLDADDVIEPPEREKLRALLADLDPKNRDAYVVRCACDPGIDGSGGHTVVDHIRLFPLRDDVRWTYRVHEQILPALRRAGIAERWTDLVVRHTGYADPALRARKLERDTRILLEELKDRPDEPFLLFNLGSIAIERQQWPEALSYLSRSLAGSAAGDSITRKLFALIARVHQMLDDSRSALRVCAQGLALDPDDAELLFRKAVVHRQRGEPAEAEACWRRILTLRRPEQFASVDMGIYGHLTRRNLAALAAERGDHEEEMRLWRAVLAECPGDREALARLERLAKAPGGTLAP